MSIGLVGFHRFDVSSSRNILFYKNDSHLIHSKYLIEAEESYQNGNRIFSIYTFYRLECSHLANNKKSLLHIIPPN